jgi:hypothetical protein
LYLNWFTDTVNLCTTQVYHNWTKNEAKNVSEGQTDFAVDAKKHACVGTYVCTCVHNCQSLLMASR